MDVLVIGAGLGGLNAARVLEAAGRDVLLLEAGEAIGGRVRTDLVDGFRLDRGFQVLNPAYPALREAVPVEKLALRPFGRGLAVRGETGLTLLADPRQRPGRVADLLKVARADGSGALALAKWLAPALAGRGTLAKGEDATLADSLDAAGVHGPLREQVLEPFLAGVLADDQGATSAAFTRWLLRWFVLGTPGLPAQGMAALPALLRAPLRAQLRLDTEVTSLRKVAGGWQAETPSGRYDAGQVVLAAGPVAAARLAGRPAPQLRGLATWWFAPTAPPTDSTHLHVDGRRRGPVVNTAVVSNAQPSYAPAGSHLVQASTLLGATEPTEAEVRAHVGAIYATSAAGWPLLAHHRLPDALPAIGPGSWQRPQVAETGLVIAGDTADASIQGALQSGRDAAGLLLARA